VNRSSKHFRVRTSSQRFVSLFITVIWLVSALQPCVMASVADTGSSEVETHHSASMPSGQIAADNSSCPHCKVATAISEHCASQADEICYDDELFVNYSRSKPDDNQKFDNQFQALAPLTSRDFEINSYRSTVSSISKSLNLPAGPPLIDLYRVYLK